MDIDSTDDAIEFVQVVAQTHGSQKALLMLENHAGIDRADWKHLVLRAVYLRELSRIPELLLLCTEAVKLHPNVAAVRLELARVATDIKAYELADSELAEAQRLDPELAQVYFSRAALEADVYGDMEAAMASVRRGLELDPDHVVGRLNLARIQAATGDLQGALDNTDRALARQPENVAALQKRGALLVDNLRLYDEGIRHFRKALSVDPNHLWSLQSMAVALSEKGAWEEALRYADRMVRIDPQDAEARSRRANIRMMLGHNLAAREDFEWAITLNHEVAEAEAALKGLVPFDTAPLPGDVTDVLLQVMAHQSEAQEDVAAIASGLRDGRRLLDELRGVIDELGIAPTLLGYSRLYASEELQTGAAEWLVEGGAARLLEHLESHR
jgi:tetratricopeptide (TPR) repeat protein